MTLEYTYYPGSLFDYEMLDEFCYGHGVDYKVSFDEGFAVIIFSSDNPNYIDEVRDQLPNTVH